MVDVTTNLGTPVELDYGNPFGDIDVFCMVGNGQTITFLAWYLVTIFMDSSVWCGNFCVLEDDTADFKENI